MTVRNRSLTGVLEEVCQEPIADRRDVSGIIRNRSHNIPDRSIDCEEQFGSNLIIFLTQWSVSDRFLTDPMVSGIGRRQGYLHSKKSKIKNKNERDARDSELSFVCNLACPERNTSACLTHTCTRVRPSSESKSAPYHPSNVRTPIISELNTAFAGRDWLSMRTE